MEINKELLRKVAGVARLELTEEELEEFTPQFVELLGYFEKIKDVDTEGIELSCHPVPLRNALREDEVAESLSNEDALKNSAHKQDGYFMGPKAV